MKNRVLGFSVLALSLFFADFETQYFGNHWWPSCHAEMICDGIAVLILAIGFQILSQKD